MSRRGEDPSLAKLAPPPCFVGPKAKTPYGTLVEVLEEKGCGLLHVRKVGDKDGARYVCHVSSLTGVTPQDRETLANLQQSKEVQRA